MNVFMVKPYKVFRLVSWPIVIVGCVFLAGQMAVWMIFCLQVYAKINVYELHSAIAWMFEVTFTFSAIGLSLFGLRDVTCRTASIGMGVSSIWTALFFLSDSDEAKYWKASEKSGVAQIMLTNTPIEPLSVWEKIMFFGALPSFFIFCIYVAISVESDVLWLTSKNDPRPTKSMEEAIRAREKYLASSPSDIK